MRKVLRKPKRDTVKNRQRVSFRSVILDPNILNPPLVKIAPWKQEVQRHQDDLLRDVNNIPLEDLEEEFR